MNNRGMGALGETLALNYLKKSGYEVLAKNCKFAGAELDIVAKLPVKTQKREIKKEYKEAGIKSKSALDCRLSALQDILVFIEVKYSSTKVFGEPEERITDAKRKQIIKGAEMFIYKNKLLMPVRFDVISIVGKDIKHIVNAFTE